MPAWCDRILWRKGDTKRAKASEVKLLRYDATQELIMSDHKPVWATMVLTAREVDEERMMKMRKKITDDMDRKANLKIPRVEVPTEISFNSVHYGEKYPMEFPVKNVGKSPVQFQFVKQANNKICKDWLNIHPIRAMVEPGKTCPVRLTVHVKHSNVQEITKCKNKLEDIIIFHVDRGADTFVTIMGNYLPSCFGSSIERLIKCRQPIRFADTLEPEKVLALPKEIWRMVDYIYKHGMQTPQIFQHCGRPEELSEIRECLDTGKEFRDFDPISMAESLVCFLKALDEPVFPKALAASLDSTHDLTEYCRQALMNIPLSHYNTFIYIISFLREVLKHSMSNGQNPDILAYVFSLALMHTDYKNNHLHLSKPFKILRHFLTNNDLAG